MRFTFAQVLKIFICFLGVLFTANAALAQYNSTNVDVGKNFAGMAKDAAGNIYVTRYNSANNNYEVVRYAGGVGPGTVIYEGLAFGVEYPWSVAVNSLGDVFITNPEPSNAWEIVKLTNSGGGYTKSVVCTGRYFTAVAVDASDNLLSMEYDGGSGNYRLMRYDAANITDSAHGGTPLYSGLALSFNNTYPWGIVTDVQGNIYLLDAFRGVNNNQSKVIKLTAASGYSPTDLITGNNISSLAIDANGNLYTTQATATANVSHIVKYTAPIAAGTTTGTVLFSGLAYDDNAFGPFYPWGLVVTSNGTIFANDGISASPANGRLLKLTPPDISVINVVRASTNPTNAATVQYTVTFSGDAFNVTPSAFTVSYPSDITGTSVTSVTPVNSTTYTVTVNTGSGDGTIRLDVNGSGMGNTLTNAPFQGGEVYTIDKTPPTGTLVINNDNVYTNAATVNLTLTADGTAPAYEMRFSNENSNWTTTFAPFTTSSSWTLATGDGLKTVYMQLRDAAGNVTTVSDDITLDQTAPETTINSGPSLITTSTTATFQFSSNETASFEASLDGGAYGPVTPPLTYTGLAAGAHTFSVRAVDQAGNLDGTPATHNWTIDNIAPTVTSVNVPADAYYHEGDVLDFTVNLDENVTVSGTPYLELTIGGTIVQADYVTGSGTSALLFRYTVQAGEQDLDGITLGSSIVLNGGTLTDAAGNNANLALNSVGATTGVRVYAIKASVTLSTTAVSPVNLPFTVTIVFSEAVTGFATGDISVTNAVTSGLSTADNVTYTVHVTPSADGTVTIQVPADVTLNTGQNGNTASNTLSLDYDGTAPAVISVNVPANGTYSSGDALTFTVNYSENVTLSGGTPSIPLTIGTATVQAAYTGGTGSNALTFSYTIQDGDLDANGISLGTAIALNGATLQDAAANNASLTLAGVGNTSAVLVDAVAPVVNSVNVPANGYYKEGDILSFTVQMSENVTVNTGGGTPYLELTIGAAAVQAAYVSGSGTSTLAFSYTVQAGQQDLDGIALGSSIILNGGTIQDAAGNDAVLTLNSVPATSGIFVYSVTPGVTLSTTAVSPVNQAFTVSVVFTEAVTGFTLAEITTTNATLSNLQTSDNTTYTVLLTPSADGTVSVQVPAGVAQNIGNNDNTASNTLSLDYDGTAPAVTSVNVPANGTYSSGDALTFTVNYSENVTLSGGTPSIPLTIGTATVQAAYIGGTGSNALTFSYTIQDGDLDANGISLGTAIALNGATLQDAAANNASLTLAGVGNTSAVLVDAVAPVVNSVNVPANGYYKEGDVLSFTVQMSENVTVNTGAGTPYLELTIGAAAVQAAYVSGSGTSALVFSYTVQPGEQDLDGIALGNSIILNGGTIQDAAGNDAVLTLNSVPATSGIFVYSVTPGVTLSTTAVSPVNQAFTVSVVFTEAVTGFTLADITATNATLSNLQTSDNITYTALVTPSADGAVSLNVPAGVAQNIGNIGNTASNTLSLDYDGSAPAITAVAVPANGIYHNGDVLAFTVSYSENVTVTGAPYLDLTIGSTARQAAYTGGSGTSALTFSYTVQNGDLDMDGISLGGNLVLNGGVIQDAAANNALPALNSVGSTSDVWVNTIIPTVTLSGTPMPNAPFTLTATFSEAVTGFALADFAVTNATLSNLQTSDNITYTVLVTPTADGAVSISIPANVAQNAGANGNQASNVISYTYDATAPAITSVDVPANGYHGTGEMLDFTVHFSENVTVSGTPGISITIGAAVVEAAYTGGTGTNALTFRYTVQDGDMDMDGISVGGSLALNGGTLQDGAGNNAALALNNTGNTSGVFVNTQRPTVTLTAAATGRVNTPVTVTLVFSEAVTGLALADINLTNGAAGNLQTTDNITYTADITPAADGAVDVSLPADAAENIGGNGNDASNTVSFTYDATAPLITAGQSFTVSQYAPVGTVVGQVAATETAGTLQDWTIATDGSGGAFEIDGAGALTVKDATILSALGGTTVTLDITVSDGLNTSIATPVTIQVGLVNQAPALDPITDVSICADTETHTLQLTGASATEPGQTYTITAAASQDVFDLLSVNASDVLSYRLKAGAAAGSITVTVTIKDDGGTANGGVDSLRRSFTLTVNSLPAVTITSDKGTTVSKGETVMLTATGGATYQWADADGIIGGQQSAVLEIRPKANTTYEVTATSAASCTGAGSINIAVVDDFKVDATNILTPNGDGRNDRWVIRNIDSYPDNELKIFDRAGRLVYQRRNYSNDWDGTLNGSPLAEGTYYYILTINGGAATTKGYITIVRDRQ
ncbi:Ig-like domain-containing protein [Chitinophaga japonensis]|uniref:Gliding motility-associated-like protein n=1 Tax=Chitinophaga japonensis TaxID=104662 RepID=A0A562SZN7_CHIJA|nr:Ig-like domain-containing protein [Chitinophaga japonensis]TWI86712.1 gliding motility-associated-like protein [Chitinophaga japonensis]